MPHGIDGCRGLGLRAHGVFFGTMKIGLLDRQAWRTRAELANAIFEWIEAFYNPIRRHSSLRNYSPLEFEQQHHTAAETAA